MNEMFIELIEWIIIIRNIAFLPLKFTEVSAVHGHNELQVINAIFKEFIVAGVRFERQMHVVA